MVSKLDVSLPSLSLDFWEEVRKAAHGTCMIMEDHNKLYKGVRAGLTDSVGEGSWRRRHLSRELNEVRE